VPTAVVDTRAQYLVQVNASGQVDAESPWVIEALMIVVAVMAAFTAGATAAAERRDELVLARLCGATRGQVTTALALESALTTLGGIAAGAIVVAVSLSGAGHDPAAGPLALPLGQATLVLAGAAALGIGATLLPGVLSARGRRAAGPAFVSAAGA
jgi:putative ABC transport system permease protein